MTIGNKKATLDIIFKLTGLKKYSRQALRFPHEISLDFNEIAIDVQKADFSALRKAARPSHSTAYLGFSEISMCAVSSKYSLSL
jgi:hypothetical protein